MNKQYEEFEKAVKAIRENVGVLKSREEFMEFDKLISGVEKKCVASLIEDFLWGNEWK